MESIEKVYEARQQGIDRVDEALAQAYESGASDMRKQILAHETMNTNAAEEARYAIEHMELPTLDAAFEAMDDAEMCDGDGCNARASGHDADGVPLCRACLDELIQETGRAPESVEDADNE